MQLSDEQIEFASDLLAAGFMAVTMKWVATSCERLVAAVCQDYERYAAAIIREARNPSTVASGH